MQSTIDCLIVGHNEMNFENYEKMVASTGKNSTAYRVDLNLNYIKHKGKMYTAPDAFNHFYYKGKQPDDGIGFYNLGNTFSAAISYLGSYLNKRGYSFDYINSFQYEKELLIEKLKKENILTIAIPTTLYVTPFPIIEIVTFIRKYNKTAKIIVGGPFVYTQIKTQDKAAVQYIFNMVKADFYIMSTQGETALVNVVNAVKNNASCQNIDNIAYKNGSSYTINALTGEDNRLSENMVDWSLFDSRVGRTVAVRTAISCPFSCSFCGFPEHAGKYQTIDVGLVEKEFDRIESLGKVTNVNIIDDTFNVPPERFKDILKMMIRKRYSFKWASCFRCQYADRETIELMKESGCVGVFLGIESGNNQVLKNMNKSTTIEKYQQGVKLLNEYGIVSFASLIVGFPGETPDTVRDTVNFIEENKPTFFRPQLWYCDPFTPIWKEKDKFKIKGIGYDWSHETMDSVTACGLIEDMFLNVKNSTWLPQYNFDFYGAMNLLDRGISVGQLKEFLTAFNSGVKQKLINPANGEINSDIATMLVDVF
ncbi:MAG: PhpK family radical SAM P-methyltransferase [Clostridia bacterium]|nr:PhpK family radical SAM P-methyltransferase [Clostridia bacterium]